MHRFLYVLAVLISCTSSLLATPEWMKKQITQDLQPFQEGYCRRALSEYFDDHKEKFLLCQFVIKSNLVSYSLPERISNTYPPFSAVYSTLCEIAEEEGLPDTTFLLSLHDIFNHPSVLPVPIFVFAKTIGHNKILIPDFEALFLKYQVFSDIDLENTNFHIPWKERQDLLIWRGLHPAQSLINIENMETKSRVIICQLSQQFPHLIDAGLIYENFSFLTQYEKPFLSDENLFNHKYQMWIDGNSVSFGRSGWRFYTGSTVLKENSSYIQWYFIDLVPWVHYVPVKEKLSDLISTLTYLQENPLLSEKIANNGLAFIREHVSKNKMKEFIRELLLAYSDLPIKTDCP